MNGTQSSLGNREKSTRRLAACRKTAWTGSGVLWADRRDRSVGTAAVYMGGVSWWRRDCCEMRMEQAAAAAEAAGAVKAAGQWNPHVERTNGRTDDCVLCNLHLHCSQLSRCRHYTRRPRSDLRSSLIIDLFVDRRNVPMFQYWERGVCSPPGRNGLQHTTIVYFHQLGARHSATVPVTRVRFRSWQCEFFERTKAPLGWTALILDVCEETTIGTGLRNSFNMSYGVTICRNIKYQETTNMQSIQIN